MPVPIPGPRTGDGCAVGTFVAHGGFKSANELVGWLLQQAADRVDPAYQPKPGEVCKDRETLGVQGMFGCFPLSRDYYYHPDKNQGHYPADDALCLEVSYTPALAKLLCLEGADEQTYLKAQRHLQDTVAIAVSYTGEGTVTYWAGARITAALPSLDGSNVRLHSHQRLVPQRRDQSPF